MIKKKEKLKFTIAFLIFILIIPFLGEFLSRKYSLLQSSTIVTFFSIITFSTIFYDSLKKEFAIFKKDPVKPLIYSLKIFITSLFLTFLASFLIKFFTKSENINQAANVSTILQDPLSAFMLIVINAPFVEEILFRHALKNTIKDDNLFIFASVLLFSSLHILGIEKATEIAHILSYLPLAYGLSKIRVKTKSVFFPIIIHAINNLVSFLLIVGVR